jgi:hypothetical protein
MLTVAIATLENIMEKAANWLRTDQSPRQRGCPIVFCVYCHVSDGVTFKDRANGRITDRRSSDT